MNTLNTFESVEQYGIVEGIEEQAVEVASPAVSSLRSAIRWLVLAAAFLIPLWFLPFTADVLEFNKQTLLVVIAGVGLVLFLIDMIRSGKLRIVSSPLYWPLGGFAIAAIVSVIFSVNRFTSVFGYANGRSFSLLSWSALLILFFLAINIFEDAGKMVRSVLTGSVAIALIFGAMQVLGVHLFSGKVFGSNSFNSVGSLNALGLLGAVMIPLFLSHIDFSVKWQTMAMRILRYAGLLSTFFLLVVLNWSILWVVTFVTVLAYIAFTSSMEIGRGKMKFFAFPLAIIVVGLFLWVIHFNWAGFKSKLPIEVAPTQSTSATVALASLRARPFGYGLENYFIGYDLHRPSAVVNNALFQARFTDSASEVMNMATEGGLLILVAFVLFLVFFVRTALRQIRNTFDGDSSNGKLWASMTGMVLLFFFYPINLTIMLVLLLLLSVASLSNLRDPLSVRMYDLEGKGVYSFIGSVVFIIGLVGVLIAGYFVMNAYHANVKLAQAVAASDRNKAINNYVASINSYNHDSRAYQALSQTLLTQIAADLKPGNKAVTQEEFTTQLKNRIKSVMNVSEQATKMLPADSENWMQRGYVYQNLITLVGGTDQLAIDMYKETIQRSPANALAHVRIGNVFLTRASSAQKGTPRDIVLANLKAAEENYKQAISLYGNYGQALYNLAATYDREGELGQAIKQFEKLEASNPGDPSIFFQLGLLYYRNNQKDEALKSWERAVALFPNYSNARWYLSLIYEERGQLDKALEQVEEIEKFNKENELVQQRLLQLQQGVRIIPPEKVLDQEPLNNQQ